MSGEGLRAVVADDHPVFLEGLVSILEDRDVEVVAVARDGDEAVAAVEAHGPDVVLMDLAMPDVSGIEATRRIATAHPSTPVLVLTMSDDDESVVAALRAGARGYLLKEAAPDDIYRAVAAVARGDTVLSGRVSSFVLGSVRADGRTHPFPFPQLSDRQREVLELVARGHDNQRIARQLGLTEKTVRNHVSTILTKLRRATRAELVAAARDAGLGADPA